MTILYCRVRAAARTCDIKTNHSKGFSGHNIIGSSIVKSATILFSLVWISAAPVLACQKPKAIEQKKDVILTEEEAEMLKDRELLENMELLRSLDKIQYLDLFTDQERKSEVSPAVPAKKKTEREK